MNTNKWIRLLAIILVGVIGTTGCGNKVTKKVKKEEGKTVGQEVKKVELPKTYQKNSGKIEFDCKVEVPEDFDSTDFHVASVRKVYCSDNKKALDILAKDKEIKEEYLEPKHDDRPESYFYGFTDKSSLNTGDTTYFMAEKSFYYTEPFFNVDTKGKKDNQEQLAFASQEEGIARVEETMKMIECQTEIEFKSYALKAEQAKEWEEHLNRDDEGVNEEEYKQDGWSSEDDAYLIHGYQQFQGLPVYNQNMAMGGRLSHMNAENAPVQAIYTVRGIEFLQLGFLYQLSEEGERVSLKSFDEIAKTVDEKINSIIDDNQYKVRLARLGQLVRFNQKQEYEVIPIWYFEVDSEERMQVIYVNATTAEEVAVQ
jgi:hypothetical protein